MFRGGVEEAAKLLSGLSRAQQKKVLTLIAKQDPQMAEKLEELVVSIEDLKYLTTQMLIDLFKQIKLKDIGLSLRIASDEVKNHILDNISKGMREEIEEVLLGPPRLVSEVEEATGRVMKVVKEKVESGEFVLKETEWVE